MKTAYSLFRRSFAAIAVTMGLLFASSSSFAQSNTDISSDVKAQVLELNKDIEKAVLKKDYSSIVDLYSDDATIMIPGGKKITGRKEIADYWLSMMQIKSMKSEIIELGGNSKMIYQIGKWTITKMENGVEKNITTDVVLIWKRENNYSYKIQLNSSNNPVAYQGKAGEPFEAVQP
ncbi:MAG: nuclear transport factor 2 family protein [Bacteroidia bacterium]|jgi:ketosteroid isomerase-like protein|nr:nuclear transport factor 2 family protein [Bacteroidia bacterium]MBP7244965.1 nuclear transport factor 2 family protein [Bacteroidia bacterium]